MRRFALLLGVATALALLNLTTAAIAEQPVAAPTLTLKQGACEDGRAGISLSASGFPANTQLTHYVKAFSPSGALMAEVSTWGLATDAAGNLDLPAGAITGMPLPEGGSLTAVTFVDEDGDHRPDAGELQANDTLTVVCPASKEECKYYEYLGPTKKECKDIIKAEKESAP